MHPLPSKIGDVREFNHSPRCSVCIYVCVLAKQLHACVCVCGGAVFLRGIFLMLLPFPPFQHFRLHCIFNGFLRCQLRYFSFITDCVQWQVFSQLSSHHGRELIWVLWMFGLVERRFSPCYVLALLHMEETGWKVLVLHPRFSFFRNFKTPVKEVLPPQTCLFLRCDMYCYYRLQGVL